MNTDEYTGEFPSGSTTHAQANTFHLSPEAQAYLGIFEAHSSPASAEAFYATSYSTLPFDVQSFGSLAQPEEYNSYSISQPGTPILPSGQLEMHPSLCLDFSYFDDLSSIPDISKTCLGDESLLPPSTTLSYLAVRSFVSGDSYHLGTVDSMFPSLIRTEFEEGKNLQDWLILETLCDNRQLAMNPELDMLDPKRMMGLVNASRARSRRARSVSACDLSTVSGGRVRKSSAPSLFNPHPATFGDMALTLERAALQDLRERQQTLALKKRLEAAGFVVPFNDDAIMTAPSTSYTRIGMEGGE